MPPSPARAGRPRLLPRAGWARAALALIVLFAILRSVAWASAQPGWLAPDEDYHWLYTEYVLTQHDFPKLDEPFATSELFGAVQLISKDGSYLQGPRLRYTGRPHGDVARMDDFGGSTREPTGEPPRPILHGPLYYTGTVLIDKALSPRAAVTRLTAMRYYSALLGGLGVFLAWLLAAQVLPRIWQQLAAAALVATQPIIAFSASTLTNDVLALAGMTAVLVVCMRLLRAPPHPRRHGLALGAAVALTILAKATMLALLPIVGLTLLLAWRAHRGAGRAVLGTAGWAAGLLLVLAGWWYVRLVVVTGSLFGNGVDTLAKPAAGPEAVRLPITEAPAQAWIWLSSVYRGYWFNYLGYEVTQRDVWYYLPLVAGAIGTLGLLVLLARRRRALLDPEQAVVRQVVVLLAAALVLALPPLLLDVRRALGGLPQTFQLGRFLTPAYPGLAICFVLGLTQLLGARARLAAAGVGVAVLASLALYWENWVRWCVERFYGPVRGDWIAAFDRVGFDKPEWVGPGWFIALLALCGLAAVSAAVLTVRGSMAEPAHQVPERPEASSPGAVAAGTARP